MGKLIALVLCLLFISYPVAGCRSISNPHPHMLDAARNAKDSQTCQACLLGIRLLDDSLCDDGVNTFMIKFFIDNVCNLMQDKDQCEALAVALVPVAVQYLRASIVPGQICSDAGVCGKQLTSFPEYAKAHFKVPNTQVECSFCKFLVARVQQALQDPDTEEEVKEAALKACQDFPAEMQDACVEYINTHEAEILAFINTMPPAKACELAGACMPQLVASHPLPALPADLARTLAGLYYAPQTVGIASNGPGNDLCDTCKIVVLEAHQMLTNPKYQKQIEDFLEQLCSSFGSYSDECQALMDEYLPLLFSVVAEYLDPDSFCANLGYCKPKSALNELLGSLRLGRAATPLRTLAAVEA